MFWSFQAWEHLELEVPVCVQCCLLRGELCPIEAYAMLGHSVAVLAHGRYFDGVLHCV